MGVEYRAASRRNREGPQKSFMGVVKEDMQRLGVREEDARNRVSWRQMIHCGNP